MKLKDKVIVVTGSTRGIGRATAEACAIEGAKVVICSRTKEHVGKTCDSLKQKGLSVSGLQVDVTHESDLELLMQHAIQTWGKIDVWINNAGLSGGYRYIEDLTSDEIVNIIDVNIKGMLLACRLIIPYFAQNDGGVLLNMSGKGGRLEASPYLTTYAATKAAVTSLTKSLASENREKPISIHSVIPGMVDTDFYKNIKTSSELEQEMKNMPYILKAFGVPLNIVGRAIADIASQEPGKVTGKEYSLLSGGKLIQAISRIIWYRMTGKVR